MNLHLKHHDYPHLSDDQLVEAYLLSTSPAHLRTCRSCSARYDRVASQLGIVRDHAAQDADAVFTNEVLQEQRGRILRRLERHAHPAEVLRFPSRFGAPPSAHRLLGPARRWVAGAAAAGLVAGLFLGFAVDRRVESIARVSAMRTDRTAVRRAPDLQPALVTLAPTRDEQILTEIEEALTGPSKRVLELRALDAMTVPVEVQEASFVPR